MAELMRIVSRGEWGAKEPQTRRIIQLPTPELYIHHTVGAVDQGGNGVWWDDVAAIQEFHMRPTAKGGRGWSDIAYSFVIGGGQIFEGRGVGIAGSHTAGRNSVAHAICVIGNYEVMEPHPEDIAAVAWLARHGRNKDWWGDITGGHRNAPKAVTACPGKNLYSAIPKIRAMVNKPPTQEDDDVSPELERMIRETHKMTAEIHAEVVTDDTEGNLWWLQRRMHHMLAVDPGLPKGEG